MDSWKQYLLAVIFCACTCKVVTQLVSDSRQKSLIQLLCGMILGITLLQPLSGLRLEELLTDIALPPDSAQYWISQGENLAREDRARRIKASCESYILDKANLPGTQVQVAVTLDDNLVPVSAEISGINDASVRESLQNILMTDLGIPKENQTWIWNQEDRGS